MNKASLSILLLAAAMGCNRASQDHSTVLASVGGEKITRNDLEGLLKTMVPDPKQARDLLASEQFRRERGDFVRQLAYQKALIAYGRKEGLDSDPTVRAQVDRAVAQAYYQVLLQKRQRPTPPGDAELTAMYQDIKAKTPGIPPFDQVKAQLSQSYAQWQFDKELKTAIPMTFADEVGEPGS